MNLDKILPKIERENLLLSVTKKCETLIKQTHKRRRNITIFTC